MSMKVLIAEPNDILRTGLNALIAKEPDIACVYEATNEATLVNQLLSFHVDLTVINQRLMTNVVAFPRGHFIVLAAEPDMAILKKAYLLGARGYLSLQTSTALLHSLLQPAQPFMFDPLFIPWAMEYLFRNPLASIDEDLLTPREQEIVGLLREGNDRRKIACLLSISEATLKTHLKNIARKRKTEPYAHLESQILGAKRRRTLLDAASNDLKVNMSEGNVNSL